MQFKKQTINLRNLVGTLICIIGVGIVAFGIFKPFYAEQDAGGSMHYMGSLWDTGFYALAVPFALIVLGMSIMVLLGVNWNGLIYQRRVAAIAGLLAQILVDALGMLGEMFCAGNVCVATMPSIGFYLSAIGFLAIVVGAFVARGQRALDISPEEGTTA